MMNWTDRHCRYFLRLISRQAVLYTEMITADAVRLGDRGRLLAFDGAEHPVVLQLGGADPVGLAEAAKIGADLGFDEINLNVGCPSDRVQAGRFGACLMAEPALVARCIDAMQRAVDVPVSVKHRLGIDEQEDWPALCDFVDHVAATGCRRFIVHARKAWLKGLSPKENRDVPPLRYELVYALKERWPRLEVTINGGITSLDQAVEHLRHVDGAMLGRAVYENPYLLADVDRRLFGDGVAVPSRHEVAEALLPYIESERGRGTPLQAMTRHMLGLFSGQRGARAYRRCLSENAWREGAGPEILQAALACVPRETPRQAA